MSKRAREADGAEGVTSVKAGCKWLLSATADSITSELAAGGCARLKQARAQLEELDAVLETAIASASTKLRDMIHLRGEAKFHLDCNHSKNSVVTSVEASFIVGPKRAVIDVTQHHTNVEGSIEDQLLELVYDGEAFVGMEDGEWVDVDASNHADLLDAAGIKAFSHNGVLHAWPAATPAAKLEAVKAFTAGLLKVSGAELALLQVCIRAVTHPPSPADHPPRAH